MRSPSSRFLVLVMAAAGVLVAPAAAQAGGGCTITAPPSKPLNPHARMSFEALQDVSRAQDQVSRAHLDARRTFESSAEYQQAVTDAEHARANLVRERAEVLTKYHYSTEFRQAQLEIWKLQQTLDAAHDDPRTKPQRFSELASLLLAKRSALSARETQMLGASDTVREARYALIDAEAQLAALRQSFADSIQSNPQWRDARAQLEQARSRAASVGR